MAIHIFFQSSELILGQYLVQWRIVPGSKAQKNFKSSEVQQPSSKIHQIQRVHVGGDNLKRTQSQMRQCQSNWGLQKISVGNVWAVKLKNFSSQSKHWQSSEAKKIFRVKEGISGAKKLKIFLSQGSSGRRGELPFL